MEFRVWGYLLSCHLGFWLSFERHPGFEFVRSVGSCKEAEGN